MAEKLPLLDMRLTRISEMVREGSVCADIGTDHGYLIAYLAVSEKIKGGFACDINEKPLLKAQSTIREYEVEDRVKTVLADGLNGIEKDSVDDIVIAGMGGDLIAKIIDECPWSRDSKLHFILQPMTKADALREYLCNNGFEIEYERAADTKRFIYTILSVKYTGEKREYDDFFLTVGKLPQSRDIEAEHYMRRKAQALLNTAESMTHSPASIEKAKITKELAERILKSADEFKIDIE